MLFSSGWMKQKIVELEEVETGVVLDFNADGKVVGIEILNLSTHIDSAKLNILQIEFSCCVDSEEGTN